MIGSDTMITTIHGWPLWQDMPMEVCEIVQLEAESMEMTRFLRDTFCWMESQITRINPDRVEIEAPECCNQSGEYRFTDSQGIAFFKCKNCSRFFTHSDVMEVGK